MQLLLLIMQHLSNGMKLRTGNLSYSHLVIWHRKQNEEASLRVQRLASNARSQVAAEKMSAASLNKAHGAQPSLRQCIEDLQTIGYIALHELHQRLIFERLKNIDRLKFLLPKKPCTADLKFPQKSVMSRSMALWVTEEWGRDVENSGKVATFHDLSLLCKSLEQTIMQVYACRWV